MATRCPTVLLSDSPTTEDQFSHRAVAEALRDLVESEPGGRCIALTGYHGGGKSSVVAMLRTIISPDTKIFAFDAWAHKGDPLRRTLLENLIQSLLDHGWIRDKAGWQRRQLELGHKHQTTTTESTPVLRPWGVAIAVALLFAPAGMQLITNFIYKSGGLRWLGIAGVFILLLPLLILGTAWVLRKFQPSKSWSQEHMLGVLTNRISTEITSEALTSPDPTSVEFERTFDALLDDALSADQRRLIIVIDNLDRLEADDALSIWSTLQTFFDFSVQRSRDALSRLWVLVPYYPATIARLWADGEAGTEEPGAGGSPARADSFIAKTFHSKFHVPLPVLSDWEKFLRGALRTAFPENHSDDEFHTIYRVFDWQTRKGLRPPTPRDIKVFVNDIGSLHRQWQHKIPLSVQALYAATGVADVGFEASLGAPGFLGSLPTDLLPSDWREMLAAIHFGVPKEKALQVLIGHRVYDALVTVNTGALEALSKIEGFTRVLEQTIENNSEHWISKETGQIPAVGISLSRLPQHLQEDTSLSQSWIRLSNCAGKAQRWSSISGVTKEGLSLILARNSEPEFISRIAGSVGRSLPLTKSGDEADKSSISMWFDCCGVVVKAATGGRGKLREGLVAPGSAKAYLDVLHRAIELDVDSNIIGSLQPDVGWEEVRTHVVDLCDEGKFSASDLRVTHALIDMFQQEWEEIAEAAGRRLKTNLNSTEVGLYLQLLLLTSRRTERSSEILDDLAQGGAIAHHLLVVMSQSAVDGTAAGACIWVQLTRSPLGTAQRWTLPYGQQGIQRFQQFTRAPQDTIVSEIARMAASVGGVEQLLDIRDRHSQVSPLIDAVVSTMATQDEFVGVLGPSLLWNRSNTLSAALGEEVFSHLVDESAGSRKFAEEAAGHEFSLNLAELFQAAYRAHRGDSDIRGRIVSGMSDLDRDAWQRTLDTESYTLGLLFDLIEDGVELSMGAAFEDALRVHCERLLAGSSKIEVYGDEWPVVVSALSPEFRRTFEMKLIETTCAAEGSVAAILAPYGNSICASGALRSQADRIVSLAFTNMLHRALKPELRWIRDVLEERADVIAAADPEIIQAFVERAADALKDMEDEPEKELVSQIHEKASRFAQRSSRKRSAASGHAPVK